MSLQDTANRHNERINAVLVHIQNNIGHTLSLDRLAEVSCLSPFHFHRIFKAHTGETINQYIQRIRLETAAYRLMYTADPISNIASSMGYRSLPVFTKAFKKRYSVSPSDYKSQKRLRNNVKLHLKQAVRESAAEISPLELRSVRSKKLVFVRQTGPYREAAAAAWSVLMPLAYQHGLFTDNSLSIGITYDSPMITDDEHIRYDACISTEAPVHAKGELGVQYLREGRYYVFLHKGAYDDLWKTYDAIYSSWLPTCRETLRDAPPFAVYLNNQASVSKENLLTEIYIPVSV